MISIYAINSFFEMAFRLMFLRSFTWAQFFFLFLSKKKKTEWHFNVRNVEETVWWVKFIPTLFDRKEVFWKKAVLQLWSKYIIKVFLVKSAVAVSIKYKDVVGTSIKFKVQRSKYTVVRNIMYKLQEICYFFHHICYGIPFFVSFAWFDQNDRIVASYFT